MTARIPVAVLGATGSVGQRFVSLLADHPWFELVAVTASDRSAGKRYGDVVEWVLETPLPSAVARMVVQQTEPVLGLPLVFSALDAAVAGEAETAFATAGAVVVSNASSHRLDRDVPLVVPEVNPDHVEIARRQAFTGGAILTNPNCSTIGLVLALKPLADAFGLRRVVVTTLQALSGAGLPGVPSMRAVDNVVPFIGGEEDKLEREPLKILGRLSADGVEPACDRILGPVHPGRGARRPHRVRVGRDRGAGRPRGGHCRLAGMGPRAPAARPALGAAPRDRGHRGR